MTDDAENSGTFSEKPARSRPGLRWLNVWMSADDPAMNQLFAASPGLTGEIHEVRIRRPEKDGAFMAQIGFVPDEKERG